MFQLQRLERSPEGVMALRRNGAVLYSLVMVGCLALLLGCAREETPTPLASPLPTTVAPLPSPPSRPSVSLVPTFTPMPTQTPMTSAQSGPSSTGIDQASPTPPSFDQTIVSLRYRIPALGLDRRLVGNMANRIVILDALTGRQIEYSNQGGVILEMRQALEQLDLADPPEACDGCVLLDYALTIEEQEGTGWLQDAVLLASVENYMAVALGPHFPTDTIVGLRRSASPYAPAHTVAYTEGGALWAWTATQQQIDPPTATFTDTAPLRTAVEELPITQLADSYLVDCEGSPVETLSLNIEGETATTVIVCPEFSLPSTLLPLYLALDTLVEPVVANQRLERPQAAFPLTALLDYKRADGARLTLFYDGALVALDADAATYTGALSSAQTISLTTSLSQSGVVTPGLSTFAITPAATITPGSTVEALPRTSILVVRGPEGLLEGEWLDTSDNEALAQLDALLDQLIGVPEPTPEGTAEPESTLAPEDIEITETPAATPTP